MNTKSVWYIIGMLLLLGLGSLAVSCGAIESPSPPPPRAEIAPPLIPHSIEGRSDCRACHATGVGGAPQFPVATHSERPSDVCLACHTPALASKENNGSVPHFDFSAYPFFRGEEGEPMTTTPTQPGEAEITEPPQVSVSGANLYTARCSGCHGAKREGVTGLAPALTLESLAALNESEIRDVISDGRSGTAMPAFKTMLSPEEIEALIEFLESPLP